MVIRPTLEKEQYLWNRDINYIGGVDEAGRGAWAGPIVAAVVMVPKNHMKIDDVRDSKLLSPKKRKELYLKIISSALDFGIGSVDNRTIDTVGIARATNQAYAEAINMLSQKPEYLLIDAFSVDTNCPQEAIIKGDQKIYSISCASILAKVYRDNLMANLDDRYVLYNFSDHKGYGTKEHQLILGELGPCDLHRFSYKPIKNLL